ncbi:RNA polymerase sigma factor, FliA/WhiG family/RNA polymerase sigma factor, sigma-70, partial [Candidatus Magnetomorum sp. HK-1]
TLYHSKVKQLAWKLYNTILGYHHSSIDVNDLYHEGLIALYKCKDKFDEDRNVQFWTYAKQRVEGAIRDYIRKLPMVSVPQKPMQKLKMYKQEYEQFKKKFSRAPSHSEMAKQLKISVEELHQILQLEIS